MRNLFFIFVAFAVFSCENRIIDENAWESDSKLYDGRSFRLKRNVVDTLSNGKDHVGYRFLYDDTLLMKWNVAEQYVTILKYPGMVVYKKFKLGAPVSFFAIDALWKENLLYVVGRSNEIAMFQPESGGYREIDLETAMNRLNFRAFTQPSVPLFVEDSLLYLSGNIVGHSNYFLDVQDRKAFFSGFLDVRYHMENGEIKTFGDYPISFQNDEMDFYRWFPSRQRLVGRSIYSFAHVDSLFAFDDRRDQKQTVERKSVLHRRELIPLDKSRLMDYSYLRDYDFTNDRYTELIADPYRDLIYSVFRPGVDPPEQRRLAGRDVAFTIMVYDADLEFQKEVFFPPGEYDPRIHFVTPEGLCLQTVASERGATRVFDVFDFTREGRPMEVLPENLNLNRRIVPLAEYLRDSLGVAGTVDSVVVISGFGCTGCLENMILEAEAAGVDLSRYAYVASHNAARIQTVAEFLSRHSRAYIDSVGQLDDYRAIGDFLTLVVLDGNRLVTVDDKFEF